MHTAFDLKKSMFSASIDGVPVDPYSLFEWGELDRLGVFIDRPVGALGGGLMILLAACAFYDVPGRKRRQRPIYPEIYLFHIGGPWGCFVNFDFWPDHKEVFVKSDPREALRAINNRGITHLLIPDRVAQPVEHRFKEPEAAHDRLKRCYAYDPDGKTAGADVTLATETIGLLSNYEGVLELDNFMETIATAESPIPLRLQSKSALENSLSFELVGERIKELRKADPTHIAARRRVDAAREAGRLEESFRRLPVDTALSMLA